MQLAHRALEHGQQAIGHVVLHAQHAQGRAALPGAVVRRGEHVGHHLLGQGRGVDEHRVLAARLGHKSDGPFARIQALRERALQQARHFGGAGEEHPLHPGVGHERGAHRLSRAGQQVQRLARHARFVQQPHRLRGHERRLLGGLGEHGVARGQCGGHLADEDGQREVPRADAGHWAERQVGGVVPLRAQLLRVVAQEVHRLAHLGHGVGPGLAGFAHEQRQELRQGGLHRVGGAIEDRGALAGGGGRPGGRGGGGGHQGLLHVGRGGLAHGAHEIVVVGRVADRQLRRGRLRLVRQGTFLEGLHQLAQRGIAGQVHALRVRACLPEQRPGQRDGRVRQPGGALLACQLLHLLHGVAHELVQRHALVGDPVHEGGVGAVFQQPAHEVGQQRLVRAHWGIDAARAADAPLGHRSHHLFVQRLPHAVQALELVGLRARRCARQFVDGGQRVRVVRGELRVDRIGRGEHLARAGEVGRVGVGLARVDRVVGQAVELRALDLAVPVGALDQAQHQAMRAAPGQLDQPLDDGRAALRVGLHHEADAVPARQRGLEAQPLQQVERELQPLGLLGVDVQADVVAPGELHELEQARVELGVHARGLGAAVARVQGRELDRDARAVHEAPAARGAADRLDGVGVGAQVALRVVFGERGLAEHVVAEPKAPRLARLRVHQGLLDRLPRDELLAHQAHGQVDSLADQGLAAAAEQPAQRRGEPGLAVRGHELAREHEAPGGGVDEERGAAPEVCLPVATADLVADERVARGRIRDAQQRLGQAHQRHPFLRAQREFLQQPLHQAGSPARAEQARACAHLLAHAGGEPQGQRAHPGGGRGLEPCALEEPGQERGLGGAGGCGDRLAQACGLPCQRVHQRLARGGVGAGRTGGTICGAGGKGVHGRDGACSGAMGGAAGVGGVVRFGAAQCDADDGGHCHHGQLAGKWRAT